MMPTAGVLAPRAVSSRWDLILDETVPMISALVGSAPTSSAWIRPDGAARSSSPSSERILAIDMDANRCTSAALIVPLRAAEIIGRNSSTASIARRRKVPARFN